MILFVGVRVKGGCVRDARMRLWPAARLLRPARAACRGLRRPAAGQRDSFVLRRAVPEYVIPSPNPRARTRPACGRHMGPRTQTRPLGVRCAFDCAHPTPPCHPRMHLPASRPRHTILSTPTRRVVLRLPLPPQQQLVLRQQVPPTRPAGLRATPPHPRGTPPHPHLKDTPPYLHPKGTSLPAIPLAAPRHLRLRLEGTPRLGQQDTPLLCPTRDTLLL